MTYFYKKNVTSRHTMIQVLKIFWMLIKILGQMSNYVEMFFLIYKITLYCTVYKIIHFSPNYFQMVADTLMCLYKSGWQPLTPINVASQKTNTK